MLFRIMYRPIGGKVDLIKDIEAADFERLYPMLPRLGIPRHVEHIYIHEHSEKGVREVHVYERKDAPTVVEKKQEPEQFTNKPRIRLKHQRKEKKEKKRPFELRLSGNSVKHGLWTAYEVAGA